MVLTLHFPDDKSTRNILISLGDFRAQIRNIVLQKMKPTSKQLIQDAGSFSGVTINRQINLI